MGRLGNITGNVVHWYRRCRLDHSRLASQHIYPAIKTMPTHNNIELFLTYNGECWFTGGLDNRFYGKDLETIEDQISVAIHSDPQFDDKLVNVQLHFDMDIIPKWLHQYQSHYFNYTFIVNNQKLN